MDYAALLPDLIYLTERAGRAILPFWRSALAVDEKADASPVTEADLAAHRLLVDGLSVLTPDIPVLSEEAADIPLSTRSQWQRWWLVDPLDGTKEFIAGSEEFTVNLALIERGQVVLGIVGVPANNTLYYGGPAVGAWRITQNQPPQALQVRGAPPAELVVVASRRHSSAAQEELLEGLSQCLGALHLTCVGSSLKFCLLAEGLADCYPRLAPTSQWDTAAAQAVLEGAGGAVVDLNGEPLNYPAREDFLNPSFLALPRGARWRSELLSLAGRLI